MTKAQDWPASSISCARTKPPDDCPYFKNEQARNLYSSIPRRQVLPPFDPTNEAFLHLQKPPMKTRPYSWGKRAFFFSARAPEGLSIQWNELLIGNKTQTG